MPDSAEWTRSLAAKLWAAMEAGLLWHSHSLFLPRELLLPLGDWVEQLRTVRNQYAAAHSLPAQNERFDWKDLSPVYPILESPEQQ